MRSILSNKKGLSPLIATILLIAFAVALGVVVMNLGPTLGSGLPGGETECIPSGGLEVTQIGGKQKVCLMEAGQESYVDISIHNGATIEVVDLQISISGTNDVFNKNTELGEVMKPGEARRVKLLYNILVYGKIEQITVTPIVKLGDSIESCNEAKLVLENILPC